MTSNYVILSIQLFPKVGNAKNIIMCNFVGRNMTGFEIIGSASEPRLNNSP